MLEKEFIKQKKATIFVKIEKYLYLCTPKCVV